VNAFIGNTGCECAVTSLRDSDVPNDQALWPVAAYLFGAPDHHTVLQRVVEKAHALTSADAAAILLYERAEELFVPAVPSVAIGLDERWLQRQGLEAAQSLALRAVEAGDVVEVLDTAMTPNLDFPMLVGQQRPGSVCVAPLEVDGAVIGVLGMYDAAPRAAPRSKDMLRAYAALAGLAIANAQARERERALRERMEALDRATNAVAAELSLDQALQRIVEIAASIVGARYAALGIVGPDGYLTDFITTGITPEERARIGPLPRGHGLLGVLIQQGEPLRVPNIGREPRRVGFPPNHPPMTSLLGVPVRVHQQVVGDLYLTEKLGATEFSEDDQYFVELLAAHAGVAIENARHYTREQDARHALQRALESLRENERRFRAIFDQSFHFLGLLSLDGTLLEANQTAIRVFGLSLADVAGRPLWETYWWTRVTDPAAQDRLKAAIAEAVQGKFVRYEVDILNPDNTVLTLDFSIKPIVDDSGQVVQLISEGQDITAIKALDRAHDELALLHERERISRDLHDGIIQDIYGGTLQLEDIAEDLPDQAPRERLLRVADHFSGVITDVRTYIQGLRARQLEGRLLSDGIAALVHTVDGRNGVTATFALQGEPYRLPDQQANTLLQITREALSNVVKHAHATRAETQLAYEAEGVTLTITDDGRGFDQFATRAKGHHGVHNLRSRTEDTGGQLTIRSTPGAGTLISAFVPVRQ
jgi:PAS domain S-box-containing protein